MKALPVKFPKDDHTHDIFLSVHEAVGLVQCDTSVIDRLEQLLTRLGVNVSENVNGEK